MRVLDLFSGIGGFSLGLERAGMRTVQFVEFNRYCRAVLQQHWPTVPIHGDVRTFHAWTGFADVVTGGFPCQDLSIANNRSRDGMAGRRSGLWLEFRRIIGEVRPRYALVENVTALLAGGLGDLLGDLAALGYDAEWHCIPASAIGAPHARDRLWIVAYPNGAGLEGRQRAELRERTRERIVGSGSAPWTPAGYWLAQSDICRVADGTPHRVERLRALGNSLVPQIAEMIGRHIMRTEGI